MTLYELLARMQDTTPTTAPAGGPAGPSTPQGAPPSGGALMQFLPLIAIIAIFYFVMILPERKKRKQREAMLSAVKKGDRVLTTSGMYATVAALNDDEITLQIDEGVRARFSRSAVQAVLDDSTAAAAAKKS